jgi:DNA-binding CsgD family transcriptional regulator
MLNFRHIGTLPISPAVLQAYETVVASIGSESFALRVTRAVQRLAHVDRLYLFDLRGTPPKVRSLVQVHEPDKPPVEHETYVRHYLPIDPIQRVIRSGTLGEGMVQIRVEPSDIRAAGYRNLLEKAGIVERVSYLRRTRSGWQCMTVARKQRSGSFAEDDLLVLGSFARLLMPMIRRNETLTEGAPLSAHEAVEELEKRFLRHCPTLTPRECQVCARAVVGMTADGAALELGIGLASVLTYRKRAYRRLGVTSAAELTQRVMR